MAIIGCIGVVVMYMLMTLVGLIADSRKELQNDRIYNDLFAISNRTSPMQAALLAKYLGIRPSVLYNLLVNNGVHSFDNIVDAEDIQRLKLKERDSTLATHYTLPAMKPKPCHVDDGRVGNDNDVGADTGDGHTGNMLHEIFATKVLVLNDVLDKSVIARIENKVKTYWEEVKDSPKFRGKLVEKLKGNSSPIDEREATRLKNDKEFVQELAFRSPQIGSSINDLFFEWQATNDGAFDIEDVFPADLLTRTAHRRRRHVQSEMVEGGWKSEMDNDPDFSNFRNTLFKIVFENKEALGLTLFEWPSSTAFDEIFQLSWWASVHEGHANHGEHDHPRSYFSGTFYMAATDNSGTLTISDPRRPTYTSANNAEPLQPDDNMFHKELRSFYVKPASNTLVMFPPWVRHQVQVGKYIENDKKARVAISFNIDPRQDERRTSEPDLSTGMWSNSILDHDNCGTYSAVTNHDIGIMSYEHIVYNEDDIKFVQLDKRDN